MAHPLHPLSQQLPWAAPPPELRTGRVPDGVEGIQALALQGRWREVVQRARATTATNTATALRVGTWTILALLKLGMAEDAASEMAKLGSLEDPAFLGSRAQGHPSLVPFALRMLRAELPWRLGRQQESLDRLHTLLHWCAGQEASAAAPDADSAAAAAVPGGGSSPGTAAVGHALWRQRHRGLSLLLASRHSQLRHYTSALALLNELLRRDGSDAEAWTEAGAVQAQLGDLTAAQHSLRLAEQLLTASGEAGAAAAGQPGADHRRQQALQHRNRGLLAFLQHDYRGAAKEFAAAAAADPTDAAAASNQALALIYSNHLGQAAAVLEHAFQQAPATLMQEPVVTNLASIYELMGDLASKQRFADWVAAAAPDDFDLAATKTGAGCPLEDTAAAAARLLPLRTALETDLVPAASLRLEHLSCAWSEWCLAPAQRTDVAAGSNELEGAQRGGTGTAGGADEAVEEEGAQGTTWFGHLLARAALY